MAEKVKKDNIFKKIGKFFKSLWVEMKKVSWPTWKVVFALTVSVVIVCVIFACIIALLDAVFGTLVIEKLLGLRG